MSEFWNHFQSFIKEKIPTSIIDILIASGYDDHISLSGMDEHEIKTMESFVNDNLLDLSEQYSSCKPFVFLPGHKKLLIGIGKKAAMFKPPIERVKAINKALNPSDTTLMNELMKSSLNNSRLVPTSRRYTDIIKEFSSYIYMLAGKFAYEVLCANLPLPQNSTIRKYI